MKVKLEELRRIFSKFVHAELSYSGPTELTEDPLARYLSEPVRMRIFMIEGPVLGTRCYYCHRGGYVTLRLYFI